MTFVRRYYPSLFLIIVAFAFYSRVWNLHQPEKYVFDEVYHAVTAKLIARNDPTAFEWWNPPPEPDTAVDWLHPPLAKYTQAASMRIFGENSFGWRLSSALFGTGVVALSIILTRRLFKSAPLSLLAGLLVSLDGLLLSMSRIAMNDIHVTFFILLTVWLYTYARPELLRDTLCKKPLESHWGFLALTALSGGLAMSTKWSGIFVIVLLLGWELWRVLGEFSLHKNIRKAILLRFTGRLLMLLAIPAVVYVLSYSQMFFQGKDLSHFYELHKQTWWYQTNLDATHPHQSAPWQWFLNLRPVWLYVEYPSGNMRADQYAQGNLALFWFGAAAVLIVLYTVLKFKFGVVSAHFKKTQSASALLILPVTMLQAATKQHLLPLLLIFSAYAIVWMPWFLSPRIMFFYHYTPAVPFLSILLAWVLWKVWHRRLFSFLPPRVARALVMAIVGITFVVFCLWYPHWTGIPTPLWLKNTVYFALPSWR